MFRLIQYIQNFRENIKDCVFKSVKFKNVKIILTLILFILSIIIPWSIGVFITGFDDGFPFFILWSIGLIALMCYGILLFTSYVFSIAIIDKIKENK
jgi:ABC-type multidrug transport system fused ATPase/permease subunit